MIHLREHLHQHGEPLPVRVVRHVVSGLVRIGLPVKILGNPVALLTVPGRRSGRPRTTLVDVYQQADGRRYVISTHGASTASWVLNLRAAGRATLQQGKNCREVTALELAPESAGPVLQELLRARLASPIGGIALRQTLGLEAGADLDEFMRAARSHPVFEVAAPASRTHVHEPIRP
jgi:deazaflavin-dependent oxidoreductase (nitroreductase family)